MNGFFHDSTLLFRATVCCLTKNQHGICQDNRDNRGPPGVRVVPHRRSVSEEGEADVDPGTRCPALLRIVESVGGRPCSGYHGRWATAASKRPQTCTGSTPYRGQDGREPAGHSEICNPGATNRNASSGFIAKRLNLWGNLEPTRGVEPPTI
jgi:hypothetical protein